MPCYHPLIRCETSKLEKGKKGYHHKAYIYSPDDIAYQEMLKNNSIIIKESTIPCGKCIGCRLEYSRQWANRGYLESKSWEQNWFCTITYDDNHLYIPEEFEDSEGFTYTEMDEEWKGCLIPKDLTQFIKNVRQIMKRDYGEENIRFMACGEYGDQGARPHYHIIFFNLNLPVSDLYEPRIQENEVYYRSHIIERAWNKGISNISEASWNTIAYVARYVTKKINGANSEGMYAEKGQIKEFFRVSRMPGIGYDYFEKYWKEIYRNDEIIIRNKEGITKCRPPKYYDDLLKEKDRYLWDQIKAKRARQAKDQELIKNKTTTQLPLNQKLIEERIHEEKHKQLIRIMEREI